MRLGKCNLKNIKISLPTIKMFNEILYLNKKTHLLTMHIKKFDYNIFCIYNPKNIFFKD